MVKPQWVDIMARSVATSISRKKRRVLLATADLTGLRAYRLIRSLALVGSCASHSAKMANTSEKGRESLQRTHVRYKVHQRNYQYLNRGGGR